MPVLVICTATIITAVLLFRVVTLWLQRSDEGEAAGWAEPETRWRGPLSAGTLDEAEFHAQVGVGDRTMQVDRLDNQEVNDTRPQWQQMCRRLAAPYLNAVASLAREGGVSQRAATVRTLAGPKYSEAIVQALNDQAEHESHTAARAHARPAVGAVDTLLQRLDCYRPWDRRLLRETLAAAGPDAVPALARALQDRALPESIRFICADTLATLDYEGANNAALQVLQEETNIELRAAALRLIRGQATPEQLEAVRALGRSSDPVLQGHAIACLARIGNESDLKDLESALDHASPWVRYNVARGLDYRGTPPAVLAGAAANGQE